MPDLPQSELWTTIEAIHCEDGYYIETSYQKKDTQRINIELFCMESDCQKSFRKAFNMQNHLRVHSGTRPYHCELCNRSFKQKGQLYKHKMTDKHIAKERELQDINSEQQAQAGISRNDNEQREKI